MLPQKCFSIFARANLYAIKSMHTIWPSCDTLCIWSTTQNNRIISFVIVFRYTMISGLSSDCRHWKYSTLKVKQWQIFCARNFDSLVRARFQLLLYYGMTRNMNTPVHLDNYKICKINRYFERILPWLHGVAFIALCDFPFPISHFPVKIIQSPFLLKFIQSYSLNPKHE